MAGLGFKDFAVGEVLTSANVDGYLMQQTVMRFPDAAARGSALGTAPGTAVALSEGMVSYLDDANLIEFYDGSGWRAAGRLLQVATATDTTNRSTTSSSFADANISISVTPISADSVLIVDFTARGRSSVPGGAAGAVDANVTSSVRISDASDVALEGAEAVTLGIQGTTTTGTPGTLAMSAPVMVRGRIASSSTSSRTYKIRFATSAGTLTLQNADSTARITVWEVL